MAIILFIFSLIVSFVAAIFLWRVDQYILKCDTPWRALSATLTTILTVWILVLMFLSFSLKVPGAYGPVQFWAYDSSADALEEIRFLAMFSLFGSFILGGLTIILAIASIFVRPFDRRWQRMIVPAISIAIVGVTLFLVDRYHFYVNA